MYAAAAVLPIGVTTDEKLTHSDYRYKLKTVSLEADTEDEDIEYDEVSLDGLSDSDTDEDLEQAVRNMNQRALIAKDEERRREAKLERQPEVVDDFIRNFLVNKRLQKTLDCFQNEWYERVQQGKLGVEDVEVVPDVYQRNQELLEMVTRLRMDVNEYREIANKARGTYDRLRKERDFHRMHHKRVVQEKNKLVAEIKRLKKHYEHFDPSMKQLQQKYEAAMKEKMLTMLERDRLVGKIEFLETTLQTSTNPLEANTESATTEKDPSLPVEDRINPYDQVDLPTAKTENYRLKNAFKAHNMAVSSLKFHPKKMVVATVSDDQSWKLWTFPGGEPVMSGSGHKEWIADCDFHPKGNMLATASGDGSVKIWDFGRAQATLTLQDHNQGVWSCVFHDIGDYLASCSMDQTAKLWDLRTGKCRQTFRGHAESVNHVVFQPFTNNLLTCSGDKTVSVWDARAGICCQTLYGHLTAVNRAAFTLKGDMVATCDADGIVKFWDLRKTAELSTVNFGPHAANTVAFDPSGSVLAVASNDGTTKLYQVQQRAASTGGGHKEFLAHEEGVQSVAFDRTAECLVTTGADGTVKIWS